MRPAFRSSRPRHLAGKTPQDRKIAALDADFDVEAALEPEIEFDFEGLFLADDDLDGELEPALSAPRQRVARHKVAFAVSVTLAALPLLVLDNFQSAAESPNTKTEAEVGNLHASATADTPLPDLLATTEAPPVSVDVTIAKATVFVSDPSTTTTVDEPTTTTTEKPDPPTTTTTVKATTTTALAAVAAPTKSPDPGDPATWDTLAKCESNGNWQSVSDERSGVRYYGGLQFSLATWQGLGGGGYPNEATKATQIDMGKKLQARQGWDAWPGCARKLGWA
jgi:hypothetical protein